MRLAAIFLFCLVFRTPFQCQSAPAVHQARIILQFESPQSAAAIRAMENNVIHGLQDTVHVTFADSAAASIPSGGRLVVFNMRGTCSMAGEVVTTPVSGEALAAAFVTDGNILPFGEILCDRIRASLKQEFGPANPEMHQYQFGLALASVMKHELYHMLSGQARHTNHGVTKPALTPLELITDIPVPHNAAAAMDGSSAAIGR